MESQLILMILMLNGAGQELKSSTFGIEVWVPVGGDIVSVVNKA
jgi:hypothetical protein